MNVSQYFESISLELNALKNRVRNFIADAHWQTDGEWKESVLRNILRRHLPNSIEVGRGFIVRPDDSSSQIDVLIYDSSKPILYRDGDLVFVTPDSVRGIIEVKTRVSRSSLRPALNKLADNCAYIHRPALRRFHPYVGLFAYDTDLRTEDCAQALNSLRLAADGDEGRVVNHLALGDSFFIKFWYEPQVDHPHWHAYELKNRAAAYFVNNLIHTTAEDSVSLNQDIWFPSDGNEVHSLGQMLLRRQ